MAGGRRRAKKGGRGNERYSSSSSFLRKERAAAVTITGREGMTAEEEQERETLFLHLDRDTFLRGGGRLSLFKHLFCILWRLRLCIFSPVMMMGSSVNGARSLDQLSFSLVLRRSAAAAATLNK